MRPPRFRLRTLLIAVAVAGMACGAEGMRRRRARALDLRYSHAARERSCRYLERQHAATAAHNEAEARKHRVAAAAHGDGTPQEGFQTGFAVAMEAAAREGRSSERRYRESARYHGELARKYGRLARSPWLPVAPDLPPPD
jgi:hypothetical protein